MAYPYSKNSGSWGAITGTLASQTDLQAALDSLQAQITALTPAVVPLDATDDTHWVQAGSSYLYTYTSGQWVRDTYDDTSPQISYIDKTGSWYTDYRPTRLELTLNSGVASEYTGDLAGEDMQAILKDGFGNTIGSVPIVFTSYSEDVVFEMNTLTFDDGFGSDIDRLEIWSTLKNTGPIIKKIEFFATE